MKNKSAPLAVSGPSRRAPKADLPPHSWLLNRWSECAPHVAPNTTAAAKHLVRCYRDELVAAGALARLGRELVIFGGPYAGWLAKRVQLVAGYTVPMNASKRSSKDETQEVMQ